MSIVSNGWVSPESREIHMQHAEQGIEILNLREKLSMYQTYGLRLGFCNESIKAFEDLIKIMKTYFTWHKLEFMQKFLQPEIDPEVLPEEFRDNLNENFLFFLLNDAKHELLNKIEARIDEKEQKTDKDQEFIDKIEKFKTIVNACKQYHFELNLRTQNSITTVYLNTFANIRESDFVQTIGKIISQQYLYQLNDVTWISTGFESSQWRNSITDKSLWSGTFQFQTNPNTALEIKKKFEETLKRQSNYDFLQLTDFPIVGERVANHATYSYFLREKSGELIPSTYA